MGKKRAKKAGAWTLAAVLGTCMLCGGLSPLTGAETVSAAPSNGEVTVEVDLRQNGGFLYDAKGMEGKVIMPSGTNVLMEFPEKYDLRDQGLVTDVKFQNPWGTCWAFGAVSSLESNALLQGVSDPDYSEKSLVWFSKQELKDRDAPDDTLEGPSVSGGDLKQAVYNMGGNSLDVIAALASWQGASDEEQVPYRNAEGMTATIQMSEGKLAEYYTADGDWSVDSVHAYDDAYRMDSVVGYPGYWYYDSLEASTQEIISEVIGNVVPQVKTWIMENGAMSLGFCGDASSPDDLEQEVSSEYYNEETYAQYNPDGMTPNHKVTVVGWDDNYPAENFSITPPGDGAWIIKNSWSDAWGDEGYFYLSYYDTTTSEFDGFLTDVENSAGYRDYDNNYQYDFMGVRSQVNYGGETVMIEGLSEMNDSVSAANVFQAEGDETLRAVGVTDARAYAESVEVVTEVYRLSDNSGPVNGELVSSQTDRLDNLLYSVIELDTPVELKEGEYFSVVQTMRLLTPGSETFLVPLEFGSENPVYVEGYEPGDSYYLNQTAKCGEGESYLYFVSEEGEEAGWMDLASEEAKEFFVIPLDDGTGTENYLTVGNAMIKAYTVDTETTLSLVNETLTLTCYDADGQVISAIENPDPAEVISVPWNTESVSFALSDESGSAISISWGGENFAAGVQISRELFENSEGILTLTGTDRGESASAEYSLSLAPETRPVDKTALLSKIEEAEAVSGNGYTAESYQALQDALEAARAVAEDESADQEEVDAQVAALEQAIAGLVKAETGSGSSGSGDKNDSSSGSGGSGNGTDGDSGSASDSGSNRENKDTAQTGGAVQTGDVAIPLLPAAVAAATSLAVMAAVAVRIRRKAD